MRFTLCKLFLGVTMAALASAGMTLHTRLWAEAIVSFSILLYIAVAILAFRGSGQARAFRIAFAAVGGGYLLLVMCNTFTPIRDLLITNRVLVLTGQAMEIFPTAPPPSTNPFAPPLLTTTTLPNGTQTVSPIAASTAFTLGIVSLDWDEVLRFWSHNFPIPEVRPALPHHRPLRLVVVTGSRGWLLRHIRVSTVCTGGHLMAEAHQPSRYAMPANSVGGRFPKHGKRTAAVREPTAPIETARPAMPPTRHPRRCTARARAARRPRA